MKQDDNDVLGGDICIDCDGQGKYPSGVICHSCRGSGRVLKGEGIPIHEFPTPDAGQAWAKAYRLAWIADTIRVYGFMNREHVERKFGISTPQASQDMQEAMRANPAIGYNRVSKRFEFIT